MHLNGSMDKSTPGLREGEMYTERRLSVHWSIPKEGGEAGLPITAKPERPSLLPALQPAIRLASRDSVEGNG